MPLPVAVIPITISRPAARAGVAASLLSLATLTALDVPAHALVIVTVDGASWDISATQVPGGTDIDQFRSTYVTSQPWNGSEATAGRFAVALAGQLGHPNDQQYSPFFAYAVSIDPNDPPGLATYASAATLPGGASYNLFQVPSTESYTYATATPVTTGVPGPLPVLGGLAAFSISRRLRRRLSLSPRP